MNAQKHITKDEYYDILLSGEIKYEWYNGMMWPVGNPDCLPHLMAGAQPPHNLTKAISSVLWAINSKLHRVL